MSEHPFQKFIDLITFDQASIALENDIQKLLSAIDELRNQNELLNQRLEKSKKNAADAHKKVDAYELEMKTLDVQTQEKRKRLDTISSQKEYQSINREIASLQEQQHDKEDELIAVWNALEVAQKEFAEQQKEYDEKSSSIEKEIAEKEAKIKETQVQVDARTQGRLEKEAGVPEEWLEKYSVMRKRVSDPVVPVENGQCSACFNTITEQNLISLNRKKLLQCRGCFRFLYTDSMKNPQGQPSEEPVK